MAWTMPAETAPHERTWMAFPSEGETLGSSEVEREEGYEAWAAVARAIADFEPVTMVADPSEVGRARRMLGSDIEVVEAPVDEFWMRDVGPTFVRDAEETQRIAAVDWIFNGWGDNDWAQWEKSAELGRFVAESAGVERVSSVLVNEGGGIHTDGARARSSRPRRCSSIRVATRTRRGKESRPNSPGRWARGRSFGSPRG
jgi:agmatine deiminase